MKYLIFEVEILIDTPEIRTVAEKASWEPAN